MQAQMFNTCMKIYRITGGAKAVDALFLLTPSNSIKKEIEQWTDELNSGLGEFAPFPPPQLPLSALERAAASVIHLALYTILTSAHSSVRVGIRMGFRRLSLFFPFSLPPHQHPEIYKHTSKAGRDAIIFATPQELNLKVSTCIGWIRELSDMLCSNRTPRYDVRHRVPAPKETKRGQIAHRTNENAIRMVQLKWTAYETYTYETACE
ncbi:hypothetical protein EVAR_7245_1 [Eumeta japonica]|uniref:Uncharacterized protein n=1 Tax=Eumeta variegata TaxID=151549 RepID=A0A4C1T5U6_EUMVA|nr:hypothetical protein EVAR_7245_1 [Eumeta japonica]